MAGTPNIVVATDLPALVAKAAAHLREAAAGAIAARGRFRIALAGGSTPRALYPTLVQGVDWARTTVFFGDERAVPPDDPQSNYRMARETLLDPAHVPAGQRRPLAGRGSRPRRRGARLPGGADRAGPRRPGSTSRCSGWAPTATRLRCFLEPRRWPRRIVWPSPSTSPRWGPGG